MPDFRDIQTDLDRGSLAGIYTKLERERWDRTNAGLAPCYVPSYDQLKTFILDFLDHVVAERGTKGVYVQNPGLHDERVNALHQIWDVITGLARPVSALTGIDPYRYLFLLAMRIRRPRVIDQGSVGFCGPATLLTDLAKREPRTYAKFAIDLLLTRRATWNGLGVVLEADDARDWQARRAQQLDFVTMLALRKRAEIALAGGRSGGIDLDLDNPDSHATTPGQMKCLLEAAGYHQVKDQTVSRRTFAVARSPTQLDVLERQLTTCAAALAGGNIVIMLVHPDVARKAKNPGAAWSVDPRVAALHLLHWINVKSLNVLGGNVTIKIVTWRWSGTVIWRVTDFLPRYFGYMVAQP